MVIKFKCFFGYHDWDYYNHTRTNRPLRYCVKCGKLQAAQYDPMYGGTVWK